MFFFVQEVRLTVILPEFAVHAVVSVTFFTLVMPSSSYSFLSFQVLSSPLFSSTSFGKNNNMGEEEHRKLCKEQNESDIDVSSCLILNSMQRGRRRMSVGEAKSSFILLCLYYSGFALLLYLLFVFCLEGKPHLIFCYDMYLLPQATISILINITVSVCLTFSCVSRYSHCLNSWSPVIVVCLVSFMALLLAEPSVYFASLNLSPLIRTSGQSLANSCSPESYPLHFLSSSCF